MAQMAWVISATSLICLAALGVLSSIAGGASPLVGAARVTSRETRLRPWTTSRGGRVGL
jgi:hypothetical protein